MVKPAPARRRPRKAKPGTKGLTPGESRLEKLEGSAAAGFAAVEKVGGSVVGMYKEPLGSHPVLLAILPIDTIQPTPFRRLLDAQWPPSAGGYASPGCQVHYRAYCCDREVACQILALNTEKAHNLKKRSLEVIRIYRGLVEENAVPNPDFAFYLEEAALVTLGVCSEQAPAIWRRRLSLDSPAAREFQK